MTPSLTPVWPGHERLLDEVHLSVSLSLEWHKADDLLALNGITSWILGRSRIYWKQARVIVDEAYLQLESSGTNQTERVSETRNTGHGVEHDLRAYLQPTTHEQTTYSTRVHDQEEGGPYDDVHRHTHSHAHFLQRRSRSCSQTHTFNALRTLQHFYGSRSD